ncbi:MAG: cytochrome c biogenesis protein ResB [Clostridiales bacterium]|nr:cytochrome c biogenesis protein ResB [Clostridiales bacterium]
MKKFLNFIRSMKFGLIILLIVVGFSVVGSFIPQTFDESWYIENYPRIGNFVVNMGMHRMFSQWYFVVVCILLGISLAQATISRLISVRKLLANIFNVPQDGYSPQELDEEEAAKLREYLKEKRYKRYDSEGATIYFKNRIGYFGSILVHFSLLAIFLFGGIVLALTTEEDAILLPRESYILADGSELHLFSFQRYDEETGRARSRSVIEVTTPDGRTSGVREITVNRPLRFNSYRFYQIVHLFAGSITATDLTTGGQDTFYLTERSMLADNDGIGIWFETVFQGFEIEEETGRVIPLIYDAPIFPNPLYYIMVIDGDSRDSRFAIPGSYVYVGNLRFDFNELINYPGIRVTFVPHPFPALLYTAFGLLMVALYLAFYRYPSILVLKGGRYKLTTLKSSGIDLEIKALFKKDEQAEQEAKPKPAERELEVDI